VKKVLIIEDDEKVQLGLRGVIPALAKSLGAEVQTISAYSREEGLERLLENLDIDLVVLDGCLRDKVTQDGLGMIPFIRNLYPGPLLAISGYPEVRARMLEVGATHECEKPHTPRKVIELLELNKSPKQSV